MPIYLILDKQIKMFSLIKLNSLLIQCKSNNQKILNKNE